MDNNKEACFDAGALSTIVFHFAFEKRFELPAFLRPVFLGSTSIHLIFFLEKNNSRRGIK